MPRHDEKTLALEKELLVKVALGDERAYDQLFKLLYKSLCFFAYKILQDNIKTEDIVQESLLKLWQKKAVFESMASLQAYLYVSVRNSCYDELEHRKVKHKHEQTITQSPVLSEEDIQETIMQTEVIRRVFMAVDTLPEQCRKVIRMTFEGGLSPKAIAEELGVAVSTVKNQKMRGIILLKKRLSDEDINIALVVFLSTLTILSK